MNSREKIKFEQAEESLLRHLLAKTAPVILKTKPASLIRLTNCLSLKGLQHYCTFATLSPELVQQLKLDYQVMSDSGMDIQVMFYDRQLLEQVLCYPEIRNFLIGLGYPDIYNINDYLSELRRRFKGQNFPHEIGVFLGYPLKDVKGFMTAPDQGILIPRGLWRIFGDPAESLLIMRTYRFAEETVCRVIRRCRNISTCIAMLADMTLTGSTTDFSKPLEL